MLSEPLTQPNPEATAARSTAARDFATLMIDDRPRASLGEAVIAAMSAFMTMREQGIAEIVGCAQAVEDWVDG